jgi:hypothetical protein
VRKTGRNRLRDWNCRKQVVLRRFRTDGGKVIMRFCSTTSRNFTDSRTWAFATWIGVCHRRGELIQRIRRVGRERSLHLRKVHTGLLTL